MAFFTYPVYQEDKKKKSACHENPEDGGGKVQFEYEVDDEGLAASLGVCWIDDPFKQGYLRLTMDMVGPKLGYIKAVEVEEPPFDMPKAYPVYESRRIL